MSSYDIIVKKRDGKILSRDDITLFLKEFLSGDLPSYQMSAMLMAIFFHGLDSEELAAWTDTMLHSGKILKFPGDPGLVADKHSTGGVGDKISIPLAPALAALGLRLPMIAGRGLGHTGGTLDKLDSIPGFNTGLNLDDFQRQVNEIGCAIIGQTAEIAPLDKKLYALRDVTATVESIPLIASSIMSKKLAEGICSLVLDVKVGRGAFMKDMDSARKLAETMKAIGESFGVKVGILYSRMDTPLGNKVGNALEIIESIEVLQGRVIPEVTELVIAEGALILNLCGIEKDNLLARKKIKDVLENGSAYLKFLEMVKCQGGNIAAIQDVSLLPKSKYRYSLIANHSGRLNDCDAFLFGKALIALGGGRKKEDDPIDYSAGFDLNKKPGDSVNKGDTLVTIHYSDEARLTEAQEYLKDAIRISNESADDKFQPNPIIETQL